MQECNICLQDSWYCQTFYHYQSSHRARFEKYVTRIFPLPFYVRIYANCVQAKEYSKFGIRITISCRVWGAAGVAAFPFNWVPFFSTWRIVCMFVYYALCALCNALELYNSDNFFFLPAAEDSKSAVHMPIVGIGRSTLGNRVGAG